MAWFAFRVWYYVWPHFDICYCGGGGGGGGIADCIGLTVELRVDLPTWGDKPDIKVR